MKKWTLFILTIIFSLLTTIFGWTLFNRLKMNYNSEGNYFDENSAINYQEQAISVYGIITFLFLVVTLLAGWNLKKTINKV